MRAKISSVGTYVPPQAVDERRPGEDGRDERPVDHGADGDPRAAHCGAGGGDERPGGGRRRSAAWRRGGSTASEIEVIIVATVTPDMFFPATACLVQDKIGSEGCVGVRSVGGVLGVSVCAAGGREAD